MESQPLLEITVESLDTALAAERGGADRIELCADLLHGGLTPSVATMRKLHEEVEIPVFPIIRPRTCGFVYRESEFAAMKRDISFARDLGVDGALIFNAVPIGREGAHIVVELPTQGAVAVPICPMYR